MLWEWKYLEMWKQENERNEMTPEYTTNVINDKAQKFY